MDIIWNLDWIFLLAIVRQRCKFFTRMLVWCVGTDLILGLVFAFFDLSLHDLSLNDPKGPTSLAIAMGFFMLRLLPGFWVEAGLIVTDLQVRGK